RNELHPKSWTPSNLWGVLHDEVQREFETSHCSGVPIELAWLHGAGKQAFGGPRGDPKVGERLRAAWTGGAAQEEQPVQRRIQAHGARAYTARILVLPSGDSAL